jgi:hypothetical protein
MAIAAKHFGVDDGQPELWTRQKRLAYGATYRIHALSPIRRQNNWQDSAFYLGKALESDPTLANDLDTFYQLALGAQPMGYRGSNEKIDLEGNASKTMSLLHEIFQAKSPGLQSLERQVYGMACVHSIPVIMCFAGDTWGWRANIARICGFPTI